MRVGGSYGTAPGDFGAAVRVLARQAPMPLPVERMITREVPLSGLPAVLREQLTGRHFGKTLVWPTGPAGP